MLSYIPKAILSLIATLFALFPFNVIAAGFVDADGNLKYLRGWLQPPDFDDLQTNPDWQKAMAGKTPYMQRLIYLTRNPSQGLDSKLGITLDYETAIVTKDGNWLTCNGYKEFRYVSSTPWFFGMYCLVGAGYRLWNIYKRYPHKTQGQLIGFPWIRFNKSRS